jgi:hypothetical protein
VSEISMLSPVDFEEMFDFEAVNIDFCQEMREDSEIVKKR